MGARYIHVGVDCQAPSGHMRKGTGWDIGLFEGINFLVFLFQLGYEKKYLASQTPVFPDESGKVSLTSNRMRFLSISFFCISSG